MSILSYFVSVPTQKKDNILFNQVAKDSLTFIKTTVETKVLYVFGWVFINLIKKIQQKMKHKN